MCLFGQRKTVGENDDRSKTDIGFLDAIVMFAPLVVGFDQGQMFSVVKESDEAFEMKYLHEVTHDRMLAAGFPCHQFISH